MTDGQADSTKQSKLTAHDIRGRKGGAKLTMVSLYDYPFARLAEDAAIDIILVGDVGGEEDRILVGEGTFH